MPVPLRFVQHNNISVCLETESYVSNGVRLNSVGITYQLELSGYRITACGSVGPVRFLPNLTDEYISEILKFSSIVLNDSRVFMPVYDGKNLYAFLGNEEEFEEILKVIDFSKVSSSKLFMKIF